MKAFGAQRVPQLSGPLLSQTEVAHLLAAVPPEPTIGMRVPPHGGRSGEHISPRQGSGTDFAETRAYQAGDDPRRIDWRASARSRSPLLRTHHGEFSASACIVVDRRAAMRFGTRARLKVTQAVRLALLLATAETRRGGEFAALLLDAPCLWLPPARGAIALQRLVGHAIAPCPPLPADPAGSAWGRILASLRKRVPRGAALTIVSDFAGLGQGDLALLRALGRHARCCAVRIVDPLERPPLPSLPLQLCWASGRHAIDPADPAGCAAMGQAQQAWGEFLAGSMRRAGCAYGQLAVDAETPGELWAAVT